jgi:hypothetical protein
MVAIPQQVDLEAAKGAVMWLRLLCDAEGIEPEDTRVNFNAVNRGGGGNRQLGSTSLAECLALYDAAIAKAEQ